MRDAAAHAADLVDVDGELNASYAVATASAFTPDGSDGHFAWCLSQLRRPDIAGATRLVTGRLWDYLTMRKQMITGTRNGWPW
jgi:hypothetical protein